MRQEMWLDRAVLISQYAGWSPKQIAEVTGLHQVTVKKYLSRFDLNGEKPEKERPKGKIEQRVDAIRKCSDEGMTRHEAATSLRISYASIVRYSLLHKIDFVHAGIDKGVDASRAEIMGSMYLSGKTLREIGETYGITRERVRQVIKKQHGLVGSDGGQHAKAERKRAAVVAALDRNSYKKHGCSYQEYKELLELGQVMISEGAKFTRTPSGAWHAQRRSAMRRGIEWNLSLWEWWGFWVKSGKWEMRGRVKGNYVMCRFEDTGAYELGNVYIATNSHNCSTQPNNPYRKGHPDHEKVMVGHRLKLIAGQRARTRNKKSGLPFGVVANNGRYQAQIVIDGRNKYLGSFGTPDEASLAVVAAQGLTPSIPLPHLTNTTGGAA